MLSFLAPMGQAPGHVRLREGQVATALVHRGFWHGHRALVRATRGRLGLWRPKPDGWGALWLTTTGRRTGEPRRVLVGYFEDGDNLVTMAMNGWGAAEPAWWLNLQAHSRRRPPRPATGPGRSGPVEQREPSANACGLAGPRSTTTSMRTPRGVRARPPSSCSSRRRSARVRRPFCASLAAALMSSASTLSMADSTMASARSSAFRILIAPGSETSASRPECPGGIAFLSCCSRSPWLCR